MFNKLKILAKFYLPNLRRRKNAALALLTVCVISLLALFSTLKTVSIVDGSNIYKIKTFRTEPAEILKIAGIEYSEFDEITTEKNQKGTIINLARAFPVTITVGDESKTVNLTKGTVATALSAAGVVIDDDDIINMDINQKLTGQTFIDVIKIDYIFETTEETVPFKTETVYSASLEKGKKDYAEGESGIKLVTYRKKLVNGEIAETDKVEETIIKPAVNAKTIIGTKTSNSSKNTTQNTPKQTVAKTDSTPKAVTDSSKIKCISTLVPEKPIELDATGRPVKYKTLLKGKATAYTASEGSVCATGVKPRPGYVAVNPKIIPYGTKLFIRTADGSYIYGYAIAADTGGFAKKNNYIVDLYFNTHGECINFGVRNVEVYILD
ncbi:MAG TPA: DUF348 domain-containing protein [Clostridiales bacterium]|nr:DUF348 domain-containing protein [Clostridiales bacterium]